MCYTGLQQLLFACDCTVRNKQFTRKGDSNVYRQRQSVENIYSCSVCEARFLSQCALSAHKNVHTTKYQCTECGKCCRSNTDLAIHRRSHSGEKPFECSVCGNRFSRARDLVVHSRIHSGKIQCNSNSKRLYQCRYCLMLFETYVHLNCHVCIHTGAKPYSCRHCSECFTEPDQLKTHLLKSHNEGDDHM